MAYLVDVTNSFVPRGERFSNSFTYDQYVQGLRRLIKYLVEHEGIGSMRMVPLDPTIPNDSLLVLLSGHSNRANVRYDLVRDLLLNFSDPSARVSKNLMSSRYYAYIFAKNKNLPLVSRFKSRIACLRKVNRVLSLYDYFMYNKSFSGFTDDMNRDSFLDYPLCMSFREVANEVVELDGSHRRCVAYFCGAREIASWVVDIDDLDLWFSLEAPPGMYFKEHWGKFRDIIYRVGEVAAFGKFEA